MKRFVLAALGCVVALVSMAQMKKLNSFTHTANPYRISQSEAIWMGYSDGEMFRYSTNFKLEKTITVPTYNGVEAASAYNLTKNVFDEDPGWEFVASYFDAGNNKWTAVLYEEDGTEIQTLDGCSYLILTSLAGQSLAYYQHIETQETHVFEVYSSPYSMGVDETNSEGGVETGAFPNPSSSMVTLTYTLADGMAEGVINVLDMSGQTMETVRVGRHFSSVNLDVSGYSPGVYIYNLGGMSKRFVVE